MNPFQKICCDGTASLVCTRPLATLPIEHRLSFTEAREDATIVEMRPLDDEARAILRSFSA